MSQRLRTERFDQFQLDLNPGTFGYIFSAKVKEHLAAQLQPVSQVYSNKALALHEKIENPRKDKKVPVQSCMHHAALSVPTFLSSLINTFLEK